MRLSVSTSAVAMTLSEPPAGAARAAPNSAFGWARAVASSPPDMVRPLPRPVVLCERASRVSESSTMTTSLPSSTWRRACSNTMSATATWRSCGRSKLEAITSPRPQSIISLTSSGRSSTSRIRRVAVGWLSATLSATAWSIIVLPALGGDTRSARWPKPKGQMRSMTRCVSAVRGLEACGVSSSSGRDGCTAPSLANSGRSASPAGGASLTRTTRPCSSATRSPRRSPGSRTGGSPLAGR